MEDVEGPSRGISGLEMAVYGDVEARQLGGRPGTALEPDTRQETPLNCEDL